jgi:hypothetical protein
MRSTMPSLMPNASAKSYLLNVREPKVTQFGD